MREDPRQFQKNILAKLIGKELSETLEKEKIEAWIDEENLQGGHRIIFLKWMRVTYVNPEKGLKFTQGSPETITIETHNLKAAFPEMVQSAVEEFKSRATQHHSLSVRTGRERIWYDISDTIT